MRPFIISLPFSAAALLLLALASPLASVRAQSNLRITTMPTPDYVFGQRLTFRVLAESDVPITDVTLLLRTPDEPSTFVGKAGFERGTRIAAEYTLEASRRQVEPFSPVEYWWEIEDSSGKVVTSEHKTLAYIDNRFTWQTLSEGAVTVAWYAGDRAFAQAALDMATGSLARLSRDLETGSPDRPITLYLYAQVSDAQDAMRGASRQWADGQANPLLNIIVVTMPPESVDTLTRMAREIPHELTHLVVAQRTNGRYANLPLWLNEGLAVMYEASPNPEAPTLLANARATNTLLRLETLCAPYLTDAVQAQLAYAQSASVVRYIRDQHGLQRLGQLLDAYADGLACRAGVERGLGLSLEELERRWLEDTFGARRVSASQEDLTPWLLVAALLMISSLLFLALIARPRPAQRVV